MTQLEMLILIICLPFAIGLGALVGRWAMRRMWLLDRPYEERLQAVKKK